MTFKTAGAGEQRREVRAVEEDALGFVDTKKPAEGRKQVYGAGRLFFNAAAGDFFFPVEDARHAVASFMMRSLFAAQFPAAILAVTAVVGGVVNDGVVELAEFFELGDESPDGSVCVVDGAVVDGGLIVERTIPGDDLVGGRNDSRGAR